MYSLHNQVTMSYNFVEELKNTSVSSQKTMQETNIKKHFFLARKYFKDRENMNKK